MKIYCLRANENWICDRIAEEWYSVNTDISCADPKEADLIWMLAGWCWNHLSIDLLKEKKVLATVHHIVPSKFDDGKYREFVYRDQFVDAYHVPNSKTANIVNQITKKPIYIVPYWYHGETWKIEDSKKEARKTLGLPEDDFIVGSFQRDTEGDTGKPKLEKGPDIFCDSILALRQKTEKKLHILLGGWRRSFVESRLIEHEIDYTLMERVELDVLKSMYTACDLYLVSSRFEGGPQALLEASALKVPIISRDVGMATDVLSPYCILDLPEQICLPTEPTIEYNYNSVQKLEINNNNKNYIEMFKRVLA